MSAAQPPPAELQIEPCSLGGVEQLEQELGVSRILAQVLMRRGLCDPADAAHFLAGAERHSPLQFKGIEAAVGAIGPHVRAGSQITVHGDYDCDGICSTALLVGVLRSLGAQVDWYLPDRKADGYGLAAHTVERLAQSGTRLLLASDCGVTAVEEVALAQELGMDVVICDHHAPRADGVLPQAPIVHPKVGGYPCGELCATAVASKLGAALRAGAGAAPLDNEPGLALVALATVADVMPLRGENRRLVRAGLVELARSENPGLRALMAAAHVDQARVDEQAIGFRLAPRLNAAGRLYRADIGVELLLTDDAERARAIAEELDRANGERRHTETRILFEAEQQVAEQGDQAAYVLAGEGWHPGVIGIVASRIAERRHRPCVVIALPAAGEPEGALATGSCRAIPAFDMLAGLHASAAHLARHGGHRAAAGLQIAPGEVEAFRTALCAHAERVLLPEDLRPVCRIDAIASAAQANLGLAEELAQLAPFGAGNPPVSLLLPATQFSDPAGFGGEDRTDHVRFRVHGGGGSAQAVCFGRGGRLPQADGVALDAVFRLELNEWNGVVEPRLLLRHAQACDPAPVELLGEDGSYLERVHAEVVRPLEPAEHGPSDERRVVRDARGLGIAAAVAELCHSGESMLVVCADPVLRAEHLRGRMGGFALCSHGALERRPELAVGRVHLALLDPPPPGDGELPWYIACGTGRAHLLWGEAELRFAQQTYENEYGLRASLTALFPVLRRLGSAGGEELAAVLRGPSERPCPPERAGRMLKVLAELELIDLDLERMACSVKIGRRVKLESSAAYRSYQRKLKEEPTFPSSRAAQAA